MELKDYYAILELQPPVTQLQIKKAYRRLAHIYHPDKSHTDPYALSRFADIKEAYEVLTNPDRREKYFQLRWLHSSIGKKASAETTTPVTLLKSLLALEKRLATADQFRMDRRGLHHQLINIFSPENIALLNNFGDEAVNAEIIRATLSCTRLLSFEDALTVTENLRKLSNDPRPIDQYLLKRKRMKRTDYWTVPVLVVVVFLLCLLIYFSSR